MALTANNVVVGVTGAVYAGPTATAAPTSASSALAAGFVDLGYVSEDGVTITPDRSTASVRAWQNADLIRESVTESTLTYKFMLLESSAAVMATYFGTAAVSGKTAYSPSSTGGKQSFVIHIVDGATKHRHYIPVGEILSVEPLSVKNGEPVGYGVTVTAYATSGRCVDIFTA